MFSLEKSGLEEVCPEGEIDNWKLHEIFPILTLCSFDVWTFHKGAELVCDNQLNFVFVFHYFIWNSILTNKILPNISSSFANFFILEKFFVFENFSMCKNIIILVEPAHQLWYPTLSSKYYLGKEENYSHCCDWKDGVHVSATSNPGMRNWNTGVASPIGKVHTWLDLLNSDGCMHTPRLVAVSCHNLKINY